MPSRITVVLTAALLLILGCEPSEPPQAPPIEGQLALVGVTLLDPKSDEPSAPSTLVIAGNHLAAVGPVDEITIATTTRQVDASGLYVIPGLWDLHTHLTLLDDGAPPLLVTQGVTSVRDVGAELDKIESLRERIHSGELLGPWVVRTGPTLNGVQAGPHHRAIETAEAAREAVRDHARLGMDLLKTHNQTSREAYLALLDEAREQGLTVVGHVPKSVSPGEACAAGQASIEHIATLFEGTYLAGFENQRDAFAGMPAWLEGELDDLVTCFAEHGTMFVPTLRAYDLRAHRAAEHDDPDPRLRYVSETTRTGWLQSAPITEMDRNPEVIRVRASLVDVGKEVVRRLHAAGAPIGAGTDLAAPGLLPGFDLHAELRLLAASGLSPRESIWTSVRGPGEAAGGHSLQGRLVAGAPADLVLLRENAFENLGALDAIEAVVLRGRYLDREELDGILAGLAGN